MRDGVEERETRESVSRLRPVCATCLCRFFSLPLALHTDARVCSVPARPPATDTGKDSARTGTGAATATKRRHNVSRHAGAS
eukprot:5459555-Prymnesium_polylepis.1